MFELAYGVILFAVIIHYLNERFLRIQSTIAITLGAVLIALLLMLSHRLGLTNLQPEMQLFVAKIDFRSLLLNGMLGFLLFAGALTVDLKSLWQAKWEVGVLALFGTVVSTFLVATGVYYLLELLGIRANYLTCLLFGAIISPTDPVAVLATLKSVKAPNSLAVKIAGESLFNDGVALVIFATLYQVAFHGVHPTFSAVSFLFLKSAIGGLLYGFILGVVAFYLIRPLKDIKTEILITLCLASAGYTFAQHIGISGPLAMVVAGLIVGQQVRRRGRLQIGNFWELVEEILNAVLFLLIGLELLLLKANWWFVLAGIIVIPLVLFVRFVSVGVPMAWFKRKRHYVPFITTILTWGGLRGGLALAMALALPDNFPARDLVLVLTYSVVLFSIIVQGLTAKKVVRLARH